MLRSSGGTGTQQSLDVTSFIPTYALSYAQDYVEEMRINAADKFSVSGWEKSTFIPAGLPVGTVTGVNGIALGSSAATTGDYICMAQIIQHGGVAAAVFVYALIYHIPSSTWSSTLIVDSNAIFSFVSIPHVLSIGGKFYFVFNLHSKISPFKDSTVVVSVTPPSSATVEYNVSDQRLVIDGGISFSTDKFGYFGFGFTSNSAFTQLFRYDPATNSMTQTVMTANPVGVIKNMFAVAKDNDSFFLGGGIKTQYNNPSPSFNDTMYKVKISDGSTVAVLSSNNIARAGAAAVYDGTNVHVIGGLDAATLTTGVASKGHVICNVASNRVSVIIDFPSVNSFGIKAVFANLKIYAGNGGVPPLQSTVNDHLRADASPDFYVYDPVTNPTLSLRFFTGVTYAAQDQSEVNAITAMGNRGSAGSSLSPKVQTLLTGRLDGDNLLPQSSEIDDFNVKRDRLIRNFYEDVLPAIDHSASSSRCFGSSWHKIMVAKKANEVMEHIVQLSSDVMYRNYRIKRSLQMAAVDLGLNWYDYEIKDAELLRTAGLLQREYAQGGLDNAYKIWQDKIDRMVEANEILGNAVRSMIGSYVSERTPVYLPTRKAQMAGLILTTGGIAGSLYDRKPKDTRLPLKELTFNGITKHGVGAVNAPD